MRGFKRLHGTLFSYSYGSITGRAVPGAACVVSKKAAASAVTRNRIKRRARGPLLQLIKGTSKPLIMIAAAKKGAATAEAADITKEILGLSTKLQ